MDSLSAIRRLVRTRRGLAIAIGVVSVGVAIASALLWRTRSDAVARLPIPTDPTVERTLALEAERAVREGPQGDPVALSPEGLRKLAEHWKAPEGGPQPGARYEPRAIDRDSLAQSPRAVAGSRVDPSQLQRSLPSQAGNSRMRFTATAHPRLAPR